MNQKKDHVMVFFCLIYLLVCADDRTRHVCVCVNASFIQPQHNNINLLRGEGSYDSYKPYARSHFYIYTIEMCISKC